MYIKLTKSQVWREGDQRSRDCPGHGYSAGYETVNSYTIFKSREELDAWILRHPDDCSELYELKKLQVTKHVTISVT